MKITEKEREPSLDAATAAAIARHYIDAKIKHPYFADRLCLDENCLKDATRTLMIMRGTLQKEKEEEDVFAETLATCELAEAWEAVARGDKSQAVEECYDVIAVMLRIIDVLEGRQELGRPNESEAKE